MAASTAKKPTAYREGRADKSKKPSIEIEIKPEGEEEEGPEGEEMDGDKSHSRKRSAKGSKNTKPAMDGGMYGKKPMDADCGCMSKGRKGKASCDGSCGKKMDRNDALTPQEYLAACELGIQGRSRSYIRARLDSAARLDLKCGAGSISEGEKCTKGTAQKVEPKQKAGSPVQRKAASVAKAALVAGAVLGGVAAGRKAIQAVSNKAARSNLAKIRDMNREREYRWKRVWETNAAANQADQGLGSFRLIKRAAAQREYQGARDRLSAFADLQRAELNRMKRFAPQSAARRRAAAKGRRDSIYADGFSPELDQLAI
jgi:hypothetical protein